MLFCCILVGNGRVSFSMAEKYYAQSLSRVPLFVTHGLQLTRLLCAWNFPGKNTGVGLPFPTPGRIIFIYILNMIYINHNFFIHIWTNGRLG